MEQLGIEPKLLLAQIVNFAIIIVVLSKLLYKPILNALDKRREDIARSLDLKELLEKEKIKSDEKRTEIIADARREAKKILDEVKSQAKVVEKEILTAAHREAEEIITKGKKTLVSEREEMMKSVEREAVGLGKSIAKRILENLLSSKDKKAILEEHIQVVEKMKFNS